MLNAIPLVTIKNVFSEACTWLKKNRKNYPSSSDVWDFRRAWNVRSEELTRSFLLGSYRLDVQKKITLSTGETIALWSSSDALVLKVLTVLLQQWLNPVVSKTCYHLKGHGGLKGAVNAVLKEYPQYRFFCKTDVKSQYDSIDHYTLLMKLHTSIRDRKVISYIWQFLNRCVEWGGLYGDVKQGISRGSPLSPLLGAFYVLDLDQRLEKLPVQYVRYRDDVLIVAPTRWKLREAIRVLNQTFSELKLEKHPDKTFIGRTKKGFDFLG